MVLMTRPAENPLTFRLLYDSPVVSVHDYCCRHDRGGPAVEEHCGSNHIVLMRRGVFCKHFGQRSVTADVNQAVFFSKGSTYRVSHPADHGDRGTVIIPSQRVLNDIVRELDPSIDDRPEWSFRFVTGPCDSGVFWRHHQFVQRLVAAESDPLEPLWADVTALQLIADVLEAAFARHGLPRPRRRNARMPIMQTAPRRPRPTSRADWANLSRSTKSPVPCMRRLFISLASFSGEPAYPSIAT